MMNKNYSITDAYCIQLFPEMETEFGSATLINASDTGSYIFHEDFFAPFIKSHGDNIALLIRAATYIEYLATSENNLLNDLAELGLLENFVNDGFAQISKHLGPASRKALEENVLPHFDINPDDWMLF